MKEIKYRAWDGHKMIEWSELGIKNWDGNTFLLGDIFSFLIKEGLILMEYSGLKDCNGKEIYEGDIISYIGRGTTRKYIQECPSLRYFHFYTETEDNETSEVIGNIYQNPELLNKKLC